MVAFSVALSAAPHPVVNISVQEDGGIARKDILVEQGVPVPPMTLGDVARLALLDENGGALPAEIEVDGTDPKSRVRWIRAGISVTLQPWQKRTFTLDAGTPPVPAPNPMNVGSLWSQYPTQIISSYDAKSVVQDLPVLSARLAATRQH
jgi:hypothetical protein